MLTEIELARLQLSQETDAARKSQLGQFFTTAHTASFMAGMFSPAHGRCRLLDAGAGIGSLSAAFIEKWVQGAFRFTDLELDAFEVDSSIHAHLERTLARFKREGFSYTIRGDDFIDAGVNALSGEIFARALPRYTHAILNPPYKKIRGDSSHRLALRRVGIETVNLYSAFVALAITLVGAGGQLVAIIPRSFCNGPYYRPFREFILNRAAIHHIHLFASRADAFRDDEVLQENVIIRLDRDVAQGPVKVSTSTDDQFSDLVERTFDFDRIVSPEDRGRFIHIPTRPAANSGDSSYPRVSLEALGVEVSTGPVVDFRLREHLRASPESGTVPLIYPCHLDGIGVRWPIGDSKKPSSIVQSAETKKWLFPNGYYCVVKRFSSKEERRRIRATVINPSHFQNYQLLGFENHLNVFHQRRAGVSPHLAFGLAVFLNSTQVDEVFRGFNGHTQVNATDLRSLKYPDRHMLIELGRWAETRGNLSQEVIDERVGEIGA